MGVSTDASPSGKYSSAVRATTQYPTSITAGRLHMTELSRALIRSWLRINSQRVVPANAGTHHPWPQKRKKASAPVPKRESAPYGSLRSQGRLVETLGIGKFHMQSPCPLPGLITMIRSKLIRSLMHPGKRTSGFARSALLACIAMTASIRAARPRWLSTPPASKATA
jgi:hypothetical protein